MRIRYLACLPRGKKKKKKEKREKKNQSQRKKKKNFAIQYTGFEKLATMGYKAFSSSALYSLYIHPRTDYHTDLRMSLPLESITSCIDEWIGLNRGLHTVHYESSNPNPIRRIDPILSNSSMLSVRVSIIVERSSRRFLFNHLRDFPQNVKPICQSVKLISIDMIFSDTSDTTRQHDSIDSIQEEIRS